MLYTNKDDNEHNQRFLQLPKLRYTTITLYNSFGPIK